MRYLIIVARNEPTLYEHLRKRHGGDAAVCVVVDRRGPGRVAADVPPVERRRRRSSLETGASHELIELRREAVARSLSSTREPDVRNREAPPPMSGKETPDNPHRVTRWLAESQHLLSNVIPALMEDRVRLRKSLASKEQECDRLETELGQLRRHFDALQTELERLRSERQTMAETFGGVVTLLGQLQGPLGEIARQLQGAPPAAVDTPTRQPHPPAAAAAAGS